MQFSTFHGFKTSQGPTKSRKHQDLIELSPFHKKISGGLTKKEM